MGHERQIGRPIRDEEEILTGDEVSSESLVERLVDSGEAVIALDGTTLDSREIAEVRAALADEGASELKLR